MAKIAQSRAALSDAHFPEGAEFDYHKTSSTNIAGREVLRSSDVFKIYAKKLRKSSVEVNAINIETQCGPFAGLAVTISGVGSRAEDLQPSLMVMRSINVSVSSKHTSSLVLYDLQGCSTPLVYLRYSDRASR